MSKILILNMIELNFFFFLKRAFEPPNFFFPTPTGPFQYDLPKT